MSGRGWESSNLPVVGDDERYWTVAQAATLLAEPRVSIAEVRLFIRLRDIHPVGKRRTTAHGTAGRYARVYPAVELIEAHDRYTH